MASLASFAGMLTEEELERRVSRLARLGRARDFSPRVFDRALAAASRGTSRTDLVKRLLTEWTGVTIADDEVMTVWSHVEILVGILRDKLGPPVSLQTALLHEFHSKLGLVREPHLVGEHAPSAQEVNAVTDPLTGLYNRRFLHEHLSREIARSEKAGGVLSVLLADISDFSGINERLGHPVGDGILVRAAQLVRESLRVVDAGCRYGGDQFVVVLPNTDMINSLTVAERIRQRLANAKLPVRVGLNYGIATFPSDGRTGDFLLKICDNRLYACKKQRDTAYEHVRRYPRFAVPGLRLRLPNGRRTKAEAIEIREIGYGGLALAYAGKQAPDRFKGEIIQEFSAEAHPVSVRPVSVRPERDGRLRVGCAYEH
jgi:diguanylate cyclase (GGDEF)-like protein